MTFNCYASKTKKQVNLPRTGL